MNVAEYYGKLPYDLSGSRTKNRYQVELLWGISMMLDLMKQDKDFTIVFDYVCDVEIHYTDCLEFHQVKTHGLNSGPFTFATLTKKKTKLSTGSILGKLYVLNKNAASNIKLVLVSNVPLKICGKNCNYGEFSLAKLPVADKNHIEVALKSELGISHVDLSSIFYIHTPMNLLQPENEIRGKLTGCFSEIKRCEPRNPNALYRLIVETVSEKACFECPQQDYAQILKNKGVSRAEFNQMLDAHVENENNGIKQAKDFIENVDDISKKRRYRNALTRLIEQMPKAAPLRILEKEIAKFLQSNEMGSLSLALALLSDKFEHKFPVEYTKEEKTLFFVITIGRFEQGAYDHENDF